MESLLEPSPKSLVLTAIRRFERKFPDGAPSPTKTIQMPTKKIVERCFLMNLDRRDDRLHERMQQLPPALAISRCRAISAIDGRRLATPEQWRAGNGAWAAIVRTC